MELSITARASLSSPVLTPATIKIIGMQPDTLYDVHNTATWQRYAFNSTRMATYSGELQFPMMADQLLEH